MVKQIYMKSPGKNDLLHLLFPHVRAEILRFLFLDPGREIFGREAARQTTLALRTVQRELSLLAAVSLVTSRKEGRRRLFRANRRHPMFPALQQMVIKGDSGRAFINKAKKPRQSWRHSARRRGPQFGRGWPLPTPRGVISL
jgi:DNA-binding transcriptional ArsR family regulator